MPINHRPRHCVAMKSANTARRLCVYNTIIIHYKYTSSVSTSTVDGHEPLLVGRPTPPDSFSACGLNLVTIWFA